MAEENGSNLLAVISKGRYFVEKAEEFTSTKRSEIFSADPADKAFLAHCRNKAEDHQMKYKMHSGVSTGFLVFL